MAGLTARKSPNRPDRKINPEVNRPNPTAPVSITAVVKLASVMTLTFDQPVTLKGTPGFTTDIAGVTALSAVKTGPNIVAVTFSAAITTAIKLIIPFRDPAIRGAGGGYVTSNQFPV